MELLIVVIFFSAVYWFVTRVVAPDEKFERDQEPIQQSRNVAGQITSYIGDKRYLTQPLTMLNLQPAGVPMTKTMAKNAYKSFLTENKIYLDAFDKRCAIEEFNNEIDLELDTLVDKYNWDKEHVKSEKEAYAEQLKLQKEWVAEAKEDGEAIDESELLPPFEKWSGKNWEDFIASKKRVDEFKADTREFFINYINSHHVMPS